MRAGEGRILDEGDRRVGIAFDQIEACLNDRALGDAILGERLKAETAFKIDATPTFIFNGKSDDRIVSAAPFETFKQKIDGLLKK